MVAGWVLSQPYQLELDLAAHHAGQSHRVVGGAPAFGRAARIEDLKAVRCPFVQWNMRMAEDDRLGVREP